MDAERRKNPYRREITEIGCRKEEWKDRHKEHRRRGYGKDRKVTVKY